jgi:hypothetical protein
MIKKIFIIFTLIFITFINPFPVVAEPAFEPENYDISVAETPRQPGFFESLWNFFVGLFQQIFGTGSYISKNYQVPTEDTRQNTSKYNQDDKDYGSRVMSESIKNYRKGVWFYEVLTLTGNQKKYENEIINKEEKNPRCPKIRISDLVYFFYTQNQKILYQRGQPDQPLEYDSGLMNRFRTGLSDSSCYLNAYSNIQDVPQGVFNIQTDDAALNEKLKADGAAVASTQLNDSIRTVIPNNAQGETAPADNNDSQKIKLLIEDTDKQEQSMLLNILPDQSHDQISCNNDSTLNRDNLRDYFSCNLTPNNWNNKCSTNGVVLDFKNIPCGGSDNAKEGEDYVKNGEGLSQRGAHGLALSGYRYKDIISLYHGNNVDVERKFDDHDRGPIKVVIITDYGNNSDSVCPKRFGEENYTKVNLYRGSGGVDKDGNVCNKYEKIPITDIFNPPNPPYRLTGDCYSMVTVPTLYEYLLGVAEVSRQWHVEAQKALAITHRHTAIQKKGGILHDNSDDQAFRCDQVLLNEAKDQDGNFTNQRIGIDLTNGEVVVDKNSREQLYSTARTAFCGPGSFNHAFDGFKYEQISYAFEAVPGPMKTTNIQGICFEGVGSTLLTTTQISTITNSQGITSFESKSHQSRIDEKYDLTQIDNGKYLKTYQGNCQLDERIFSPLNQLVSAFNANNPGNQLSFLSCYRSLDQQTNLWQENLNQNNGNQYKTISQINYPGTSPHHTGRAIDFSDKNGKLTSNSPAYQWLVANASKFGFYHHQLEPEHWDYNP